MNPRELEAAPLILPEDVLRARASAQTSGKRVVEILEEQSGLPPEAFVAALGATLGYTVAFMHELDTLEPDFDLLPYAEALAHGCILARRPAGELVLTCGDPFDPVLRPWVEERVACAIQWCLAHAADVAAYLARYGESMRAMDSVLTESAQDEGGRSRLEELSLRAISEAGSPVVRLVQSTLYDALRAGATWRPPPHS